MALLVLGPPANVGTVPVGAAAPTVRIPRPGTVPVELDLPGRGITAPVVQVGTDPAGGLVIPDPPSTVGWWSPSALAGGGTGPTVLAGHVDSRVAGLGALSVLREITVDEPVLVRGADGRTLRYTVAARREYAKADLPQDLFTPGGPPGLVLVTCGGAFDPTTRQYADNVVVFADPAP